MGRKVAISAAVLASLVTLVGTFEGLRTTAYRDPVGVPTICFGETRHVYMGETISPDQCKQMLGSRLTEFARGVDACLRLPTPDKTFVAFVSFAYNVGTGAFCSSTLVRLANAGDLTAACNELPKWANAGGHPLPGLVTRRAEERTLCLQGVADGVTK
jgi:lysozyme